MDKLIELDNLSQILTYERQPQPHNRYHGNILLRGEIPEERMRQIATMLAAIVSSPLIQQQQP